MTATPVGNLSCTSYGIHMDNAVIVTNLPDLSDVRGLSFSIPPKVLCDLAVRDVHIAAVQPGYVRGNHYHEKKTELITVIYADAWSFHWDTGPDTQVNIQKFDGQGAVSLQVPLLWSHAVKNDGIKDLWLFNMTDMSFDPLLPDSALDVVTRKVA